MHSKSGQSILWKGAIGFLVIVVLVWAAEVAQLPHLLYGEDADFRWARVGFRSVVVLGVWGWFHYATRRLLRRLHELEEFLRVCSWCRRLNHNDRWLTMEEFFGSRLATETSHGICPECAQKQFAAHRTAVRVPPKT